MRGKTKAEQIIIDFVCKHTDIIVGVFAIVISLLIQLKGVQRPPSGDWSAHFDLWFKAIKSDGLAKAMVDYPAGFDLLMWIMVKLGITTVGGLKWVTWIFQVIAAISVYLIVKLQSENRFINTLSFASIMLLPSLVLNTSDWGQVDAIYVSIILVGIAVYLYTSKYMHSKWKGYCIALLLIGFSIGIKQSAIFIIPLVAYAYCKDDNISLLNVACLPLGYILLCLPKILSGANIGKVMFKPWIDQTMTDVTVANFTNVYSLFHDSTLWNNWGPNEWTSGIGNCLCIFLLGILFLYILSKKKLKFEECILMEVMFVVIICCIKPGIHDRYMLLADVLSIIYCFISQDKYKWVIAGTINFISFYNIMNYLNGCLEYMSNIRIVTIEIITLIFVAFTIWIIKHFIDITKNKENYIVK